MKLCLVLISILFIFSCSKQKCGEISSSGGRSCQGLSEASFKVSSSDKRICYFEDTLFTFSELNREEKEDGLVIEKWLITNDQNEVINVFEAKWRSTDTSCNSLVSKDLDCDCPNLLIDL